VVVGEGAGEKKMDKIKALNIPTLDEDGFFNLIRSSSAKQDDVVKIVAKVPTAVGGLSPLEQPAASIEYVLLVVSL
jgi:hypothetical protein